MRRLCVLLLTLPALAQAAEPFQLVRSEENYRALADPALRAVAPEPYKYLPLGADPDRYLSLGGEWRLRAEHVDAPRYGLGTRADGYVLQRLLLHADLHLGSKFRVYAQLGRHDAFGKRVPAATDVDRQDVQQLFVDWLPAGDAGLRLRLGRQELQLDPTQRFVAVREAPNIRQSFDGLRATYRHAGYTLDAFAFSPVVATAPAFDDARDRGQRFAGAQLAYAAGALHAELAVLSLVRDAARYGAVRGRERRRAVSARIAARDGPLDVESQVMLQGGSFAGRTIRAWAASADLGYRVRPALRFGVRVDAGSGDRDPQDDRLQTLQPFFPKGAYFDETGLSAFANTLALRPNVAWTVQPSLTLTAAASVRSRVTRGDAVYGQPAVPLIAADVSARTRIGTTFSADAVWKANRYVTLSAELARAAAGPVVRDAGGRRVWLATVIGQLKF